MLKIKRLYLFIIQTFFPVFIMTFGICLFIVLMQFLWKYIEDFVGKGLDNTVLAELFFYAALSLIPLALPLSILLASLMAFGSLGERLELLSIKAAGVSLLRAMKPLILLVAIISTGAFFFQNEAMPRINVKFRSLLISIKQKSPELDIPEGSFYSGINGYSLYVKKKDKKSKILHDVIIYDTSMGFNNMSVFVCDSALMRISADKNFLLLNLYNGQRFANFNQATNTSSASYNNNKFVPYGRENFKEKTIIIPFNTNFNRIEESSLEGTQISKNITQLNHSIDSMAVFLDSLNRQDRATMKKHTYLSYRSTENYIKEVNEAKQPFPARIDFDSLLNTYSQDELIMMYNTAVSDAENSNASYLFQSMAKIDLQRKLRSHEIEWHRKFTLSFACLIFFFIGAPLGAIIRKGGLGMPVVTSVILFIVYYIIDNVGYKFARDGVWEVWQGIWLSSFILFPLGVFLTYKSMNDSALFNTEAYSKFARKLLLINNDIEVDKDKGVDIASVPDLSALSTDQDLLNNLQSMDQERLKDVVRNYQQYGYDKDILQVVLSILKDKNANFFDIKVRNLDYNEVNNSFMGFTQNSKITIAPYIAFILFTILETVILKDLMNWMSIIAIVVYAIFFIRAFIYYFDFYKSIDKKVQKNQRGTIALSFVCLPLFHKYFRKQMKREMDNIKW